MPDLQTAPVMEKPGWGKRLMAQAEENLSRLSEAVAVRIEQSYNKVERTRRIIDVAGQMVKLRQESERLTQNQVTQGVALVSERRQATATAYQAQADLLKTSPGYLLARAELERETGLTPGV